MASARKSNANRNETTSTLRMVLKGYQVRQQIQPIQLLSSLLCSYIQIDIMKKNPKVILLGDTNVGKTSILQVLHGSAFASKTSNTLGACFQRYELDDGHGQPLRMDLWDTAGQEKFRSLLTLYYKNSDAVVIVFDVTQPGSLQTVDYWARQIEQHCESPPAVVLVANKVDLRLQGQGVRPEDIRRCLTRRPQWRFVECSAKENLNVKEIFRVVGILLRAGEKQRERTAQTNRLKIDPSKLRKNSDSSCC